MTKLLLFVFIVVYMYTLIFIFILTSNSNYNCNYNYLLYRYYDDPVGFYKYFSERYLSWKPTPTTTSDYKLINVVDVFLRTYQSDKDYQISNNKLNGTSQYSYQATSAVTSPHAGTQDSKAVAASIATKIASTQALRVSEKVLSKTVQLAKPYILPIPNTYQHNISHIWPYHIIPMAIHGIYMLKRSNCPCLCIGIDVHVYRNNMLQPSGNANSYSREIAYMKIIPIDCGTPRRVTLVSPQSLETYTCTHMDSVNLLRRVHFDGINFVTPAMDEYIADSSANNMNTGISTSLQRGRDYGSKTIDFVNAMIDFAVFKLHKHPVPVLTLILPLILLQTRPLVGISLNMMIPITSTNLYYVVG